MSAFGNHLRAARLGFGWVPRLRAFVRVCGSGPFHVTVAREAAQMQPARVKHVCWWEGDPSGERLLALSKALSDPDLPVPSVFWLGDDGRSCEPAFGRMIPEIE